nr:hypothetical protein CFP56_64659 [Quercus suber]
MVPKRSSGATTLRQPPVPRPSTSVPLEKESVNLGGDINTEFNEFPNTTDGDHVCGSILAQSDNVTKPSTKTVTPSPIGPNLETTNGPNLDPTIATSKPTRWTRVARPSTSQEKTEAIVKLATRVQHTRALSDHNPIAIKPEGIMAYRNKPFRFEQMWLKEDGCGDTINAIWEDGFAVTSMPLVAQKIKLCGTRLTKWSRQSFGSIRCQIKEKTRELIRAEWVTARGNDTTTMRIIQLEVKELLDKENLVWQQRARSWFLKSGDRNPRYFYSRASHRGDCLLFLLPMLCSVRIY